MLMAGAIIAGIVAVLGGALTLTGVIYTARAQKEPSIIRITQDVAAEAIETLQRERDEARAANAIHVQALATLHDQHESLQENHEILHQRCVTLTDENIELRRLLG